MKKLTYLAFIITVAFAILVLLLKWGSRAYKTSVPSSVGDITLVIDAGHGGIDGGAVAEDGTAEDGLNLSISLKLEQIASLFGVNSVMTRERDEINYPESAVTIREKKSADQKARLKLINETPAAVLISIHQNKYTSGSPHGAQVFYGRVEGSRELAESAQTLLCSMAEGASGRSACMASEDIYLMKNCTCPAILAECGFLSNSDELSRLKTDRYQQYMAAVLGASFLSNYSILETG